MSGGKSAIQPTTGLENGSANRGIQAKTRFRLPKETLSTLIENTDPAMQIVKCENKLLRGLQGNRESRERDWGNPEPNPWVRLIAAVPSDNCTRFVIQD